jgi:hypothetical protein
MFLTTKRPLFGNELDVWIESPVIGHVHSPANAETAHGNVIEPCVPRLTLTTGERVYRVGIEVAAQTVFASENICAVCRADNSCRGFILDTLAGAPFVIFEEHHDRRWLVGDGPPWRGPSRIDRTVISVGDSVSVIFNITIDVSICIAVRACIAVSVTIPISITVAVTIAVWCVRDTLQPVSSVAIAAYTRGRPIVTGEARPVT